MWKVDVLSVWVFCIIPGTLSSVTSNYKCAVSPPTTGGATTYTSSGPDTNIAFSYMVEDPDYEFDCCGRLTTWEGTTAAAGLLQLQVWRKQSKDSYIMIGENAINIDATGQSTFTFNVPAADQILVNKGDFIGWHNEGNEMLLYQSEAFTSTNYATMFRRINLGDLYPGDIYNWSNVEAYNDRRYAIKATTTSSTTPSVTLTTPVTIPDYIKSGATVSKVTWGDTETGDNSTLKVYFQKAVGFLSMDFPSPDGTGSGYLTATNTYRPRSNTVTYFVYDQCFNTATFTQTITVQQTQLVINNLPATVTVNETGTASQLLHTITVTDPTDQWYCKSTWSTGYPFILKAITTSSYGFYKVEHAVLDYDTTSSYLNLPIECVENRATDTNTVTSSISVYINKNQPPTFTNLDASLIISANESHRGDTIFQISASDPEGDDLTYRATYNWQSGRLLVTQNGAVSITSFLVNIYNISYTMYVTVTDTAGNTDIGYLSVSVNNTDYPVTIRTTPTSPMAVHENTANHTLLYKFEHDDLDQYDTKTYSVSFSDNKLSKYFSIDYQTGEFRTSFVEIDYEDLGSVFTYTVTVMVGDPKGYATTSFTIEITNENESPRFTKNHFVIEADEAIDGHVIEAGTLFSADLYDEDSAEATNGEFHEYLLNCSAETHRFYTETNIGMISYRGPYDIDVSGTPEDVECQISVVDRYGLTASANLYIHVKNVNEFSPEFTQSNYSAYVATNTLIGKSLLTVSAIDHDNADDDDNEITYSVDQSGGGISLLIQISHTGIIYTAGSFASYTAGGTLGPIILQASNYGVALRTGTSSIYLRIPEFTTTVTTTTDRHYDFYEDSRNYMWLIVCVSAIGILILILSLVLFRVCHLARIRPWCYACCMRGICCRPKKEGPRGFGDKGYDLASFGHKQRYADEEIDGWLKTDDRKGTRSWAAKPETDDMDGWLRKIEDTPAYRQPYNDEAYEGPDARYDDQPLYEMFRIPDNVPSKATYDDPGSRWKKRSSQRPY